MGHKKFSKVLFYVTPEDDVCVCVRARARAIQLYDHTGVLLKIFATSLRSGELVEFSAIQARRTHTLPQKYSL